MKISSVIKTIALVSCVMSGASNAEGQVSPLIGIGYGWGGSTVLELTYSNGDTDRLKANEGVSLFGGADVHLTEDYILRGTVGYKWNDVSARNGDISFERIPLELTFFKSWQHHKFGAGLAYHMGVSLDCQVSGVCNETDDFKNSLGYTLQYEYRFELVGIGAKYTHIDYTYKTYGVSGDGSGIDIYLALHF